MKNLDGIKTKTSSEKNTRAPEKIKQKKKMNLATKKAIMWILVGIFSAFFIIIGFFSIKLQFEKPGDMKLLDIFRDATSYSGEVKEEFQDAFNKIFNSDEETSDISDQQIEEWEEKLFPELINE